MLPTWGAVRAVGCCSCSFSDRDNLRTGPPLLFGWSGPLVVPLRAADALLVRPDRYGRIDMASSARGAACMAFFRLDCLAQ